MIDPAVKKAIYHAVEKEPFANVLKFELILLEAGHSVVAKAQFNGARCCGSTSVLPGLLYCAGSSRAAGRAGTFRKPDDTR